METTGDPQLLGYLRKEPGELYSTINESTQVEERTEDEVPRHWDLFTISEDESSDSNENTLFKTLVKFLKVLVYLTTFCIVLGSAVVSKGTMLLMTSVIAEGTNFTLCVDNTELERDEHYVVKMNESQRWRWIWCLLSVLVIPELFTFARSSRICLFKKYKIPEINSFIMVFSSESLHVIGICFMLFIVFPRMHILKALSLTTAVCFLPSLLNFASNCGCEKRLSPLKNAIDMLAVICQASGPSLCIFFAYRDPLSKDFNDLCIAAVSLVLISCGWWENFIYCNSTICRFLIRIRKDIDDSRHFMYIFIPLWKILLTFVFCIVCLFITKEDVGKFLREIEGSFKTQNISVYLQPLENLSYREIPEISSFLQSETTFDTMLPVFVAAIHVVASYLCYACGKFVCKICIQGFSYALPVALTTPVLLCLMNVACDIRHASSCSFSDVSLYIFWNCPKQQLPEFFSKEMGFVWILWLLSQIWITSHLWNPKSKRMASTNELFVNPTYSTALIDQSLAFNRRKDQKVTADPDTPINERIANKPIPQIYACATMWHETPDEMEQLLKSIMRMDIDQCFRSSGRRTRFRDFDCYELETHIFFDDAFVIADDDDEKMVINNFVKDLITAVDTAASKVYKGRVKLDPPIKVPTPYGGRLIWRLWGDNFLIAHLKNKEKIRHKKRWSQVMYMYYLLGYQLMNPSIPAEVRDMNAKNTYILALDGDIDFQADAVQLLVDLMNKHNNLGAACGRIHPVGRGMMVYYQKFEYAIGHWLQKATEDMIGCVLCSPGCFSLFRAEALMGENVMRRYATKSREAIEYVQFDQGEDRWLCTLLLQAGWRVEYSAASDAYTHCPESFTEFYTQRRRWAPSTMANIMDLLVNYKKTVECNDNISLFYIAYQLMLMVGTILGPGTIFLMLVGAMLSALGISSSWHSFMANLFPIAFFILLCFVAKNDTQILVAQIFSAAYALLMMAVLVGISLQLVEDGLSSPSAIFLLSMTGSFLIAALVHPQEFWCVVHGLIYFLSIPSMYLLLALYSIINLHVVSWGTREVQAKKTKKQLQQEMLQMQAAVPQKAKKTSPLDWFNLGPKGGNPDEEEGSITFGLANLFRCMCCTYPKPDSSKFHLVKIGEQLEGIQKQMQNLQAQIDLSVNKAPAFRRRSSIHGIQKMNLGSVAEHEISEDSESDSRESDASDEHTYNSPDSINQDEYWLTEPMLEKSPVKRLMETEKTFWKEFIDTYLYPLADDPEEKAKVARQLKELRNKVVFGILMLNSLFILIVFLLQMQKDILHIDWPLNGKVNITYLSNLNEVRIDIKYLNLEPINLVLVFFFTLILVVQFIAMLFHRFQTLSHILASANLSICSESVDESRVLLSEMPEVLQKLNLRDDDNLFLEPSFEETWGDETGHLSRQERTGSLAQSPGRDGVNQTSIKQKWQDLGRRRSTVQMLERTRSIAPRYRSLSMAFDEALLKLNQGDPQMRNRVRRLSKNPFMSDFLKKHANTQSRTPATPMRLTPSSSLAADMDRLDNEWSPKSSIRQSWINKGYDASGDSESVRSMNMLSPPSPNCIVQADVHGSPNTNQRICQRSKDTEVKQPW